MTGGLGRTLADIRAELDGAVRDGRKVPTHSPLFGDLDRILSGAATDEPPEFGTPTPAQWWARLLTLEPAERLNAIAWLMRAADAGHECWSMEHSGRRVRVLYADGEPVAWQLLLDPRCEECGFVPPTHTHAEGCSHAG